MPCFSPLKGWKSIHNGGLTFDRTEGREKMDVACGQCLGCRLDRCRSWAMRIVHESQLHDREHGNCFLTLTYRSLRECTPEQRLKGLHVPDDWSLNKEHMRNFLKRLRKALPDRKVRYFYCGEYGSVCRHGTNLELSKCGSCNVGRPHYHVCLFGHQFKDLEPYGSKNGNTLYTSKTLENLWSFGNVDCGELNFDSAAYTAGYVLKKITGAQADEHYCHYDDAGYPFWVEPEYISMSRGNASYKGSSCGIGAGWLSEFESDVYPGDVVPVPGKGVYNLVPRYYDEIFKAKNPELMEEIKSKRREWIALNPEELSHARLMDKFKCTKAQQQLYSKGAL